MPINCAPNPPGVQVISTSGAGNAGVYEVGDALSRGAGAGAASGLPRGLWRTSAGDIQAMARRRIADLETRGLPRRALRGNPTCLVTAAMLYDVVQYAHRSGRVSVRPRRRSSGGAPTARTTARRSAFRQPRGPPPSMTPYRAGRSTPGRGP